MGLLNATDKMNDYNISHGFMKNQKFSALMIS